MSKETDTITSIVTKLINNGAVDEIVVAVLESALENAFEDLEILYENKNLEDHNWQDYADNLQFVHSCLKVLRWFTTNDYSKEQIKANLFSLKVEELY